ncbi:MAG TPA: hypothetical protein VFN10_05835 [Thermoanaerobaculia bacterium]|nr:hypothetical protein [Thermoanaerobaculia bacterium]
MPFPSHLAQILDSYGVRADTKAALYDLYVSMGPEVLDVFADIAEGSASVAALLPEDTVTIRRTVVERFLRKNHPRWIDGTPTASLWHPRELEGRASGLALPLGDIPDVAQRVVGDAQPIPDGLLILGRNAHYGGRQETISFDVVAADLDDAIALATAEGQQHTTPGSAGETSGTFDSGSNVALLWEVQPNVYKPAGERNRNIARIYRRHRNWHLLTLASAIDWLRAQQCAIFILRGSALAIAHEVNPEKPVSPEIAALHDRTVRQVAEAMNLALGEPSSDDEFVMLDSCVMNVALRKHVLANGAEGAIWKLYDRDLC